MLFPPKKDAAMHPAAAVFHTWLLAWDAALGSAFGTAKLHSSDWHRPSPFGKTVCMRALPWPL